MAIDYAVLKNELLTDPLGLGYAGKSDSQCADLINKVQAGPTPPAILIRADLTPAQLLDAIDTRDFVATPAIPQSDLTWFASVTQMPIVKLANDDGSNSRTAVNLTRMIQNPGTQGTFARLNALAKRNGSRAEQLFGPTTFVTPSDIATAKALP